MRPGRRVRVTRDGRIVIPREVREAAGIPSRSYAQAMEIGKGAVLVYDLKMAFDRFCEPFRQEAERIGFTREELDELIHKIRREKRESAQRSETDN